MGRRTWRLRALRARDRTRSARAALAFGRRRVQCEPEARGLFGREVKQADHVDGIVLLCKPISGPDEALGVAAIRRLRALRARDLIRSARSALAFGRRHARRREHVHLRFPASTSQDLTARRGHCISQREAACRATSAVIRCVGRRGVPKHGQQRQLAIARRAIGLAIRPLGSCRGRGSVRGPERRGPGPLRARRARVGFAHEAGARAGSTQGT